jgi:hypothetical protein
MLSKFLEAENNCPWSKSAINSISCGRKAALSKTNFIFCSVPLFCYGKEHQHFSLKFGPSYPARWTHEGSSDLSNKWVMDTIKFG